MYIKIKPPLKMSAIARMPFNATANRNQFRIAIIDNEPFPYTAELRSHEYNVTELGDIRDFAAVAEYPIVACDIMDVGGHFGATHQGAHVLLEIRRRYPNKFLIAYSAGSFDPTYKKYWDACDVFVRRDSGFEQWIEVLDNAINTLGDPVRHWRRVQRLLLEADVSAFEIYLLEEAYIKSILKKNDYYLLMEIEHVKKVTAEKEMFEKIAVGLILTAKLVIHSIA